MTQKETLLIKYYELNNELKALRGEETDNIEELTSGWRYQDTLKNSRVYELKDRIERLNKAIETQKAKNEKQARVDAFYQTEKGKARKEYLEELLKKEEESFTNLNNRNTDTLKTWIKDFLGDHWTVRRAGKGSVDFQIWDADKADYVFGSEIEIRYEKCSWMRDGAERFETNIGAMGSFNVLEDDVTGRARFYMDLGKFLANKGKLEELKHFMRNYEEALETVQAHVNFINYELENPTIE